MDKLLIKVDLKKSGERFRSLHQLLDLEPLDKNPTTNDQSVRWYLTDKFPNSWDGAYQVLQKHKHDGVTFAEPDINHDYVFEDAANNCDEGEYLPAWPAPPGGEFAWYLKDNFSQLSKAQNLISHSSKKVKIAHFDTGYDPGHSSLPMGLNTILQRSFINGELPSSAVDRFSTGMLKMPGHGTGTIAILAGKDVMHNGKKESVGGAPHASVIPVRIAKSVVLLKNTSFALAVRYAIQEGCRVISMSMGGLASRLWAERINEAYEAGVVMVTAAGNNYRSFPTRKMIYPARFERVIGACGVTHNHTPYFKWRNDPMVMQGNWGPDRLMAWAMAAYTPNVPWAVFGCKDVFRKSGAGTSSATPQIAAAAALLIEKHAALLKNDWTGAETVRQLLFTTANRKGNTRSFVGNGILQAANAVSAPLPSNLPKAPVARVRFPLITVIFGNKKLNADEQEMLEVELAQFAGRDPEFHEILLDIDETDESNRGKQPSQLGLSRHDVEQLKEILAESPITSTFLKTIL